MGSVLVQKDEQKIQITRLAASSSKISNFFKKRMNRLIKRLPEYFKSQKKSANINLKKSESEEKNLDLNEESKLDLPSSPDNVCQEKMSSLKFDQNEDFLTPDTQYDLFRNQGMVPKFDFRDYDIHECIKANRENSCSQFFCWNNEPETVSEPDKKLQEKKSDAKNTKEILSINKNFSSSSSKISHESLNCDSFFQSKTNGTADKNSLNQASRDSSDFYKVTKPNHKIILANEKNIEKNYNSHNSSDNSLRDFLWQSSDKTDANERILSEKIVFPRESMRQNFKTRTSVKNKTENESRNQNQNDLQILMKDIDLHSEFQNYLKDMTCVDENSEEKIEIENTKYFSDQYELNSNSSYDSLGSDPCEDESIQSYSQTSMAKASSNESFVESMEESVEESVVESEIESASTSSYVTSRSTHLNLLSKNKLNLFRPEFFPDEKSPFHCHFHDSFLIQLNALSETHIENCNVNQDESEKLRKIKSENFCNKQESNRSTESFAKKSFENILFPSFTHKSEFINNWLSSNNLLQSQLVPEIPNHESTFYVKEYEKIKPIEESSDERVTLLKKSKVLCKQMRRALSSKFDEPCASKSNCFLSNKEKHSMSDVDEPCGTKVIAKENGKTLKSRSSFRDLVEIYNKILKDKKKSQKKSLKQVSNLLVNFVDTLLNFKKNKYRLIRLPQIISPFSLQQSVKVVDTRKGGLKNRNFKILQEYVNTVQEMLLSTLSINQIIRINNITENLEKNYRNNNFTKNQKSIEKIISKKKDSIAEPVNNKTNTQETNLSAKKLDNDEAVEKNEIVSVEPSKKETSIKSNLKVNKNEKAVKKSDSNPTPNQPSSKPSKSVIKTQLIPSKAVVRKSENPVKMSVLANKVLIKEKEVRNEISRIDDKNKKQQESKQNTTRHISEIPTPDRKSMKCGVMLVKKEKEASQKKTKLAKPGREQSNGNRQILQSVSQKEPEFSKKNIISTKCNLCESKNSKRITNDASLGKESNTTMGDYVKKKTSPALSTLKENKKNVEKKSLSNNYEYDQQRLKVQHPIEAILESSESKTDGYLSEDSLKTKVENVVQNKEVKPSTKSSKIILSEKRIKMNNKSETGTNQSSIYSKELTKINYFDRSKSNAGTKLDRTKSVKLNVNTGKENNVIVKNSQTTEKKYKFPKYVKSVKGTSPKKNRRKVKLRRRNLRKKLPFWRFNTICYSFVQKTKKKSTKTRNFPDEQKDSDPRKKTGNNSTASGSHQKSLEVKNLEEIRKAENLSGKNLNDSQDSLVKSQGSKSKTSKKQIRRKEKSSEDVESFSLSDFPEDIIFCRNQNSKFLVGFDPSGSAKIIPNERNIQILCSEDVNKNPSSKSFNFENAAKVPDKKHKEPISNQNVSEKFKKDFKTVVGEEEKCSDFNLRNFSREQFSNCKLTSATFKENSKDLPIFIYPPSYDTDVNSFSALLIQSDSFLKSHSSFSLTKSKIKSLLNSNSDRKFVPTRVTENKEESPFVTFMLTPKQKATAGIPSNQIKIVFQENLSTEDECSIVSLAGEDVPDNQDALKSIEKFIDALSKSKTKSKTQCKNVSLNETESKSKKQTQKSPKKNKKLAGQESQSEKNETAKKFQTKCPMPKVKNSVPCQRLQTLFASSDRKIYHECQKKKQIFDENLKKVAKQKINRQEVTENKNFVKKEKINATESSDMDNKVESLTDNKEPKIAETISSKEILVMSHKDNKNLAAASEPIAVDFKTMQTIKSMNELTPDLLKLVNTGMSMVSISQSKQESLNALDGCSKVFDSSSMTISESDFDQNNFDESGKKMQLPINTYEETVKCDWNSVAQEPSSGDNTKSEALPTSSIDDCSILVTKTNSINNISRNLNTYEIKIHCQSENFRSKLLKKVVKLMKKNGKTLKKINGKRRGPLKMKSVEHLQLLKSFVSGVESRPSEELLFFDAEDYWPDNPDQQTSEENKQKSLGVETNLYSECNYKDNIEAYPSADFTKDKDFESVSLTPSDALLITENFLTAKKEEKIFDKITQNLESENVPYAIALLEGFYKKFEEAKSNRHLKLPDVLQSIEEKSQNLMAKMEKNGWLKVLSLLEEISEVFIAAKNENPEGKLSDRIFTTKILEPKIAESLELLDNQVLKAKRLMSTIQILNDKKFVNFNVLETQSPIDVVRAPAKHRTASHNDIEMAEDLLQRRQPNFSDAKIVSSIRNSLRFIKSKIIPSKSQMGTAFPMGREMHEYENLQNTNFNTDSSYKIHETKKAIRIPNAEETSQTETLKSLRNKIRNKRQQIQSLMNLSHCPVLPEVQAIKNLVTEKMQNLEEIISELESNQVQSRAKHEEQSLFAQSLRYLPFFNLRENIGKLSEKTSFLNLSHTYKNFLTRSTTAEFPPRKQATSGPSGENLQTDDRQIKVFGLRSDFVRSITSLWTDHRSLDSYFK